MFENGNNKARLKNFRNIDSQPLEETFKFYERAYGSKAGFSKAPKEAMIRLLSAKDQEIMRIVCDGREIAETSDFPYRELGFLSDTTMQGRLNLPEVSKTDSGI